MGRAALKSVGENPKPTGTFRPGAEGTEMNRFQSWVYSFGCRRWGQQLAISLEVVERLLTSDVHRFPTFTSHFCIILHHSASFCIILHHSASFCIFVFLPYASGDSLMSCPGHPGHWVVERPCCLSAGAAAGNCHAWTLFRTIAIHCNGHSAHAVARGYRFIRFIQFFRFWFFRFTDERLHHWNVRDAILWIYVNLLLLLVSATCYCHWLDWLPWTSRPELLREAHESFLRQAEQKVLY